MKVLILGASGFIGNFCFDFFSEKYDVTGIDLVRGTSDKILVTPDFRLIQERIEAENYDVILNCSGSSDVASSFTNPATDFQLNTFFVQQLLVVLKEKSPRSRLINISSAAVYGNPTVLPISETASEAPLSPYGFHKLLSENILKQYSALFGTQALSIRIFSAYGPGLKRQFFYELFKKFSSGKSEVELSGTGAESRDFIYIADIARAIDLLIHLGDFNGVVYNLGSEVESFIAPTAGLFADTCGFTGKITFTGNAIKGYPLNWKADMTKLNNLGFSPAISLAEGLQHYYNWVKEH